MVCARSPPRDAPDLPPPALGLGSPGRVGLTQGLGWGAGPRWPPLPGEQLWVEVPRPLTQASGSEGHREAAAVAAGRCGSVEGVSRDQGPAGRRGCRGGRGRGSGPGPSLSPPTSTRRQGSAGMAKPQRVFAGQLWAIIGTNGISEELD